MLYTKRFALKGNIIYAKNSKQIITIPKGYLVCHDGIVEGVYETLPVGILESDMIDYGDKLILPGLIDLHTHAPQYAFRGIGMDLELLDWLNQHTFPEEAKYKNVEFAKKAYGIFVEGLKKSLTTRVCVYGTIHEEATLLLMELLEASGIKAYVGKINMDRNSPKELCEKNAAESLRLTKYLLEKTRGRFENIKPILTPRFIPSCSDELMKGLAELQKEYYLPMQSHLSENLDEIAWVKELNPKATCYADAYRQFGFFSEYGKTIMAHCVYSSEEEMELLKKYGVYIAICTESNINLSSGIAPVRTYLDKNIPMGLGTDIAGGSGLSMFRAMVQTIQASKLYNRLVDDSASHLTIEEVFYLATKGGGSFFGNVGSFEPGYELDAVVIDDQEFLQLQSFSLKEATLKERLERAVYLTNESHICAKYVNGIQI